MDQASRKMFTVTVTVLLKHEPEPKISSQDLDVCIGLY